MKKKFLLLGCSVIFALLVGEIFLRLFWNNPYAGSSTDKVLKLRIHHKNLNQQIDRSLIDKEHPKVFLRTNDRSYIEPAIRFADPDFIIVFLGGSTTECIIVDEEKRFPFLVSKLFEEKGLKVNSLNIARSGTTTHDSINILLNHVIAEKPDIVILMHAINDIGLLMEDKNYSSRMGQDISYRDIGKYTGQIVSIHSAFAGFIRWAVTSRGQTEYPHAQIDDIEPFRSRLKVFVAASKALGIVPILMTQPVAENIRNEMTPGWLDPEAQIEFNQAIREVAQATNTEIIDLERFISSNFKDDNVLRQIFYDGVHVTNRGSSLYAKYITERLYEILGMKDLL